MALLVFIAVIAMAFGLMAIDWTPGRYKVGYCRGTELSLGTRVTPGVAYFEPDALVVEGEEVVRIPLAEITSVDLSPYMGSRRVFRLKWSGQGITLMVVRFIIGGQFAQGDYFAARRFRDALRRRIPALVA